jgi:hypothetical protein
MSNNLPFYSLLRRQVDIIIALDASANIQTTPWFERTDGSQPINARADVCRVRKATQHNWLANGP